MDTTYSKKVNVQKLITELNTAGISVDGVTTDIDNSLILRNVSDKIKADVVVDAHIYTNPMTLKEKYNLAVDKLDFIASFLGLKQ